MQQMCVNVISSQWDMTYKTNSTKLMYSIKERNSSIHIQFAMNFLIVLFGIISVNFCPTKGRSALTDEEADQPILDLNKLGPDIYGYPDQELGETLEALDNVNFNPEETGPYYEGDILYPKSQQRNGLANESFRWKNGVVPIEMRGLFSKFREYF